MGQSEAVASDPMAHATARVYTTGQDGTQAKMAPASNTAAGNTTKVETAHTHTHTGTVNECFRNYAVVDEPFAGYTANTHLMNRLTDHAQRQQRSLRELLTQSASIVLKHHAAQTRI